jgi:hypothetical protein
LQTLDLSDPALWQQKYLPAVINPNTFNILWGGSGSGKSQSMIQLFLAEICNHSENQYQTFFVIRKVAATLRNSVFADFKNKINEWGINQFLQVKPGYMEIHSGTNKIVFLGCDDPEKLKSLSQAKYIWIEEATELFLDDFTQITLRLRGKSNHQKRFFLTFNPVSDTHWIKKRFFDEVPEAEQDQILRLHGTYRDALSFLDANYITRMEALREVNETMYEIYALGHWGIWDKEKLFAKEFDEEIHVFRGAIKAKPGMPLYLSFDFNSANGGNTCLVAQHTINAPKDRYYCNVHVLKVYRMHDLEAMCQTILAEYPGFEYHINGDRSGKNANEATSDNKSNYQLIANYLHLDPTYQMHIPNANPRYISSRLHTNLVFKHGKVLFSLHDHNEGLFAATFMPELIADLKAARINNDGSLDAWKKENPQIGHCLDALRYYLTTNFYQIVAEYGLQEFGDKIAKSSNFAP